MGSAVSEVPAVKAAVFICIWKQFLCLYHQDNTDVFLVGIYLCVSATFNLELFAPLVNLLSPTVFKLKAPLGCVSYISYYFAMWLGVYCNMSILNLRPVIVISKYSENVVCLWVGISSSPPTATTWLSPVHSFLFEPTNVVSFFPVLTSLSLLTFNL